MRTLKIGRDRQCDIVIPDERVSRVHAELSRNGYEFIYKDMGRNGTSINGRMIHNERVAITPGTPVLLAGRISLPWPQVYALLPEKGIMPSNKEADVVEHSQRCVYDHISRGKLGVGWGILAFVIPLAGWIMYFLWKDETPRRASLAGILGTVSFILNMMVSLFGL